VAVVLRADPLRPDPAVVAEAAERLRRGGLVAFPTESFYGLGALARLPEAVRRLVAVKRRPSDSPILVIVADRRQLGDVVESVPPVAERLIECFWPGSLTLVFTARSTVSPALTGGSGRLGVRQPGLPLLSFLAAAVGAPVTATSANRSGAIPPTTAEAVKVSLGDEVDLILDGGPTAGGLPSTVLDVTTEPPTLIREGKVTVGQLREVCEIIQRQNCTKN
jgi:L-threonylcarbamoyladenylate synthase